MIPRLGEVIPRLGKASSQLGAARWELRDAIPRLDFAIPQFGREIPLGLLAAASKGIERRSNRDRGRQRNLGNRKTKQHKDRPSDNDWTRGAGGAGARRCEPSLTGKQVESHQRQRRHRELAPRESSATFAQP